MTVAARTPEPPTTTTAHTSRTSTRGGPPARLLLPALIGLTFLVIPVLAVLLKASWRTLPGELGTYDVLAALRLSLETTTVATLLCLLLGVPLAWLLARVRFRGRGAVRSLVTLPLVLPPVVGGFALLLAFGQDGVLGAWLDTTFGVTLPFTSAAVVMAQTFVALPFTVISVEGAFRASDERYDDAAATLGASRWVTFRSVTLPLALPGVVSGAVLSWARALGEFGATITFAGNFPGTTRTMPIEVYIALQQSPQAAIAVSLILIAISVAVLAILRERWLTGVSA